MHLSLSDLLTCPRCGADHGLVLMPEVVRERYVESGVLGCPNCRERYAITHGIAELRVPGGDTEAKAAAGESWGEGWDDREWAVRLGGLLGLDGTKGVVLVAGPAAVGAGRLRGLVEGVEVVEVKAGEAGGGGGEGEGGGGGVRVGERLPFRTGSMRGVALTGSATWLLEEGLRVLSPRARLLLEPVDGRARERVAAAGGVVVLEEGETLVVMGGA
jgi:uncharacterized protein YbaR (Trm112 family)